MKHLKIVFVSLLVIFASCATVSASNVKVNYMTASQSKESGPGGGLGKSEIIVKNVKHKYLNVVYNSKTGEKVNIYLPNTNKKNYPVVFAIHGGAFMTGSATGGDVAAQMQALNHGYAVVSVNYRLSGKAKFPAAVSDVKAAIRYIRKNAQKYHLNKSKFVVWGDSSGANLAALAGATGGTNKLYDKSFPYQNVSDKVQAVVDYYGPINFGTMTEQFKELNVKPMMGYADDANSPESKYLGEQVSQNSEKVKESDPTTYLKKNGPVYFIAHGTSDRNVPYTQSINFANSIAKVEGKNKVKLTLIKNANHGGSAFENPELINSVFSFLDSKLKVKSVNLNQNNKDFIEISTSK